jgi:putative addiction module component (TIGR02574 family)
MPADGNGRAYLLASDSRAASGVFLRGVEAAWSEEIKRRIEDIDSGKVRMIPYEEVRRRLAALLSDAR